MVASDETDPGSPGASHRKSEGGSDPEGVGANHEDDVIFWRERALRLAESNEAGTSAVMERRRPGAAAAALDALLHPIAGDDGGYDGPPTATGTSAPHSGARGGVLLDRESRRTADPGGVSTATKKRRAAAHAAVASLHAVAADLAEVAEALDLELVALAEGTVETHARETRALDERARRAAAPLRRRRDTVERLVEHIEQILEGTIGTDFDTDDKAAQLIKNEAVRLRRCRDDVARDAFAFGENERAKSAYTNEKDAFLFEKPKQKRQPARGRPGKPPKARSSSPETRRRSLSSDTHPEPHTLRNPPWDARIAVDTSRDDAARTERSRSPSRSRSNSRGRSKDAGDVYDTKQHAHAFGEAYAANAANLTQGASEHARTYNPVDDAAFTAEALETRAQRAVQLAAEARAKATVLAGKLPWYQGDVHPRTVFRPPNPGTNGDDFTSALWPDFDAYGGGLTLVKRRRMETKTTSREPSDSGAGTKPRFLRCNAETRWNGKPRGRRRRRRRASSKCNARNSPKSRAGWRKLLGYRRRWGTGRGRFRAPPTPARLRLRRNEKRQTVLDKAYPSPPLPR